MVKSDTLLIDLTSTVSSSAEGSPGGVGESELSGTGVLSAVSFSETVRVGVAATVVVAAAVVAPSFSRASSDSEFEGLGTGSVVGSLVSLRLSSDRPLGAFGTVVGASGVIARPADSDIGVSGTTLD